MASRRVTIEFLGDDKSLSKTARSVDGTTRKLGDTFKRVGKAAAVGLGVGVAAAAAGLAAFGKSAVEEAREAQKVTAQTNAVIKSTGGAANVTADQVANLAEKLSLKAGIDDELIQSGSNVLLTFKNIANEAGRGNKIFDRATTAALDMSVALDKDMRSSSIMLGKALNDPIAGITALGRAGVQFSEKQKKTIERMVESGNTLGAQKLILKELDTQFKGSAAAQATAGDKAKVAWDNFQEEIGTKLLPLLDKLAVWFVAVVVPALQRFAAWFQQEGLPVIKRFGSFMLDVFGEIVAWVRKNWPEISRVIRTVVTNIVEIVKGVVALLVAIWRKWGQDLLRVAKIAWDYVYRTIKNALKVVQGVINVVTGIIKGDWSQVWKGIKQIFGGIWDQIKNVLKTALKVVREMIRNAWDAVKDIVKGAWGKILDLLKWYLGKYRDAIKGAWDWVKDTTRRVWDGIKDVLGNAFGWVKDKIGDAIQGWRNIIDRGWDGIKRVFGFLKDGVRAIPEAFKKAKDGIGRVWDAVKKTVGTPIYYIVKYAWNPLAGALDNIPKVGDWSVDNVGSIPHWRKGGYTGPGAKDKPAGVVHADEFVIRSEARQRIERTNPGFLDKLNKTGLPGHKGGGFVDPDKKVYVDGEPLSAVHAAQLLLAGNLMGARQSVMQGSWQAATSYSGTSHTGSGVADTSPGSFAAQAAQRRVGIAAWARNIAGAAYAGSGAHIHGVSLLSPGARGNSQAAAYYAGGDGLGGSDYGPRPPLLPGLMDKLSRFRDLALSGGIGALVTGLFKTIFGASTATPKFGTAWADAQEKLDGMQARDGWWPIIARTLTSSMDDIAKYASEALKDAGAWMEDKTGEYGADLFGDDAVNITKAWNALDDVDVPFIGQGGIVRARPGGTLALLGEAGQDEAVIPLDRGRPMGGETLVAELHVYLDGKQIENSQVRLKRLNGKLAYL